MSKVLTVTLNPAIDKTIMLSQLEIGGLNRVEHMRLDPGGKGVNVAKVLRNFSVDVTVMGFMGNSQGELIQGSLLDMGIATEFTKVSGVTRTNLKIVDNQTKVTTEINEPGFEVKTEELQILRERLTHSLQEASYLVLGGSIPKGVSKDIYKEYILLAKEKNVQTILDADGEVLKEGIKAGPFAIKPNIYELEQLVGRSLVTEEDILNAGRELLREGIEVIVISMGAKGAIVLNQQEAYRTTPFSITPQSTVGAGDSMVATMAYTFLERKPLEELARWVTAAGTVTASKAGTEVCSFDEVQRSLANVKVTQMLP